MKSVSLTFTFAFSPGLYVACRGQHLDVQHPLLRRHDDLLRLGVHLAVGDGDRLDEEVRHVLLHDRRSPRRVLLPFEADHLAAAGRRRWPAARTAARCRRPGSVLTSSLTLSPGAYSRLSGISSRSLKRKLLAVEAVAADDEDVAAFDRVLLGVGQLVRQAILPGFARLDLLLGLALRRSCRASTSAPSFRPACRFSS